jgi:hypothetical protein
MALGTNIFYYKEAALTTLQASAPYTDPLTWGHFVRDTTNNADYWIEPGTGILKLRDSGGSNYTGFNFQGFFQPVSSNIDSGETISLLTNNGIILSNEVVSGGKVGILATIQGLAAATPGHVFTVSSTDGITYANPLTINPNSSSSLSIDSNNRLSISSMSIAQPFTSTQTSISNFITNDSQQTNVAIGDIVILSGAGGTFVNNGDATGTVSDYYQITVPGSGMQNFTVAASSGPPLTISDGGVLRFIQGPGIRVFNNVSGDTDIRLSANLATLVTNEPTVAGLHVVTFEENVYNYTLASLIQGMTSFNVAANANSGSGTIQNSGTVSILGGLGINSVRSASQITLNLEGNIAAIASLATPASGGNYLLQLNQSTGVYSYALATTVTDTSLGNTDQTLTGTRNINQASNALMFNATAGSIAFINGTVRISTGDLETVSATSGLILKAANGSRYRIKVNNIGALTSTLV